MKYLTMETSDNRTTSDGRMYPGYVDYHWQNGTDTVNLSLSDPIIISNHNTASVTNVTTIGIIFIILHSIILHKLESSDKSK
jgi:hypothetical protein